MTLNQLIFRAASTSPDAQVMDYWDQEFEEPTDNAEGCDTLAEFIAKELHGTFDEDASDSEQLATAVKVMQSAADDLAAVACALANIDREREAEAA